MGEHAEVTGARHCAWLYPTHNTFAEAACQFCPGCVYVVLEGFQGGGRDRLHGVDVVVISRGGVQGGRLLQSFVRG